MAYRLGIIFVVFSLLGCGFCPALLAKNSRVAKQTLRFAPLPMENRETLIKQFRPLLAFLEQQLNTRIVFDFSENYAVIIDKFSAGTIDLAYLGPLPYITLRGQCPEAEPLVHFKEASGQASYTCSLVTLSQTDLPLEHLQGQTIALTQPLSTCGYLSVHGLLRKHGSSLAENKYRYLERHDAVALAVAQGAFLLGGVKTSVGKKYAHLGLVALETTPPLPAFTLVANRNTVSSRLCKQIQQVLVSPEAQKQQLNWGQNVRHGAIPASDRDFDPVRRLKGTITIPTTGNY